MNVLKLKLLSLLFMITISNNLSYLHTLILTYWSWNQLTAFQSDILFFRPSVNAYTIVVIIMQPIIFRSNYICFKI